MGHLEDVYTAEWFAQDFADLQPEFDLAANALDRQFRPNSVLDVGCGPGMLLSRFLAIGVNVIGVEGSSHGIAFAQSNIRPFISHRDIRDLSHVMVPIHGGLVVCTEVAEHLDESDAPGLVRFLCAPRGAPIVFTAAPPGQEGHHHVNCQPKEYWLNLFANHGVILDADGTHELKTRWQSLRRLAHMRDNLMVLR